MLPDGIKIGVYPAEDSARFTVTDSGLTLVTPDMLRPSPPPAGNPGCGPLVLRAGLSVVGRP